MIPNVKKWYKRGRGEIEYHMTQALTGHGCFSSYLHKYGRLPTPRCLFCGQDNDDAEHTLFTCDAWHTYRRSAETAIGEDIRPDNLVNLMMESDENWRIITVFITQIIKKKEEEERARQRT